MQYLSAILILGACSIAAGAQTLGDYPPRFAHERAGRFEITAANVYLCSSLQSGELSSALLQLDQALFAGEARRAPRSLPAGGGVLVGLQNESPLLRGLLNRCKKDLPKSGLGQEGFLIDVAPNRILITAAHPAGLYYGIRRVTALAAGGINCGTYADWPAMRWRGLHVLVSGRASIPAIEELLTSYMPQRRLNELILEVGYNYQFKSHPEIAAPDGLTFDDCRRLAAVAAANYIRIVPEIDCLGHQSWAKTTFALLRTHPEFDETPDAPVDNSTLYCRSWCPSDPDVYRVVDDLADELIDAFHADAFHVGMDEVFLLGKCPRCKG
ncbi:MAG TPA: family 20 glycosylhydrolase, partial [Chthonomonadales bacterium]|nr:family 20 glycosylhydrolase [Chthonomonadales bacterium]